MYGLCLIGGLDISIYSRYGIYSIVNKITGQLYIGKTTNSFGDRWDSHKAMLRNNYHFNRKLQEEWNRYGEDNFRFDILFECVNNEDENTVNKLEQKYIHELSGSGLVYNICEGGKSPPTKGKHLSEHTKQLIGEKNRVNMTGKKHSSETKQKMSDAQRKRFDSWTEEDRVLWGKKMSELNCGYHWSEDQKQKMVGNKNGAKYSAEDVLKMRELKRNCLSDAEISRQMNVPKSTVNNIVTYKRWKDL